MKNKIKVNENNARNLSLTLFNWSELDRVIYQL